MKSINKTEHTFEQWFNALGNQEQQCCKYILKKYNDFKGKIAIIGSSINEKYPMGRDIDMVLIGLGIKAGKSYIRNLFYALSSEFNENIKKLVSGLSPNELDYPLIDEMRHTLDDPEISEVQEVIPGHGGTNIRIAIRPKALPYDKNFLETYVQEGKYSQSGKIRTFFDIIVDLSYQNLGIEKNIKHWENEMKRSNQKYVMMPKTFKFDS